MALAGPEARISGSLDVYASDLAETQRRLEEAGGKIIKPAYSFPGGRFHFADPDGYELAVWSDR